MLKLNWRHGAIPACITFGPAFMTRMGGMVKGGLGDGVALTGTVMLVAGLLLMLELVLKQQAYLEKLNPFGKPQGDIQHAETEKRSRN